MVNNSKLSVHIKYILLNF